MYCPNFLEFYQKDIVPIGPKDRKYLLDEHYSVTAESSHWLIALDGRPALNNPYYYTWNIVVYQASAEGFFLLKQPYYVSESFEDFNQACAAADKIAEDCRFDRLIANTREKQIV